MAKFRSCTCKKRKGRSRKRQKCYKSGILTRNPFLNFLRKFRRQNCGKSILEIAKEGAKQWKSMSDEERCRFKQEAWSVPKCIPKPLRRKRSSRSSSRSHKRMRSSSSKHKRSRSHSSSRNKRSRSRRRC